MRSEDRGVGDRQTYRIIGAAMAVHTELGCGFLEAVYKAALTIELRRQGVAFVRECRLPIRYKDELLPPHYRVDFICWDEVIVEVKAADALGGIDHAQVLNYLRASGCQRGLLLNFGGRSLERRRVVWGYQRNLSRPSDPETDPENPGGQIPRPIPDLRPLK